ncbi:hypothetical protein LX32DRAFT_200513 [Colletotrichum zoysiae]|uniref:Uncharacterized protein n=1 Tax=Colletotrichum zoysiae TaxID=1216348 RepID=A0AAD9H587_9PEZI|nr:hypothetical protein LX32DRAFT_200513 [Colletotrichum zoysiae]
MQLSTPLHGVLVGTNPRGLHDDPTGWDGREPGAVPIRRFQHCHTQNHIRRHPLQCWRVLLPIRVEYTAPPCSNTAKTSACCPWYSPTAYCISSENSALAKHITAYVSTTHNISPNPGDTRARVACLTLNAAAMVLLHSMLWNCRSRNNTSRHRMACRLESICCQ